MQASTVAEEARNRCTSRQQKGREARRVLAFPLHQRPSPKYPTNIYCERRRFIYLPIVAKK